METHKQSRKALERDAKSFSHFFRNNKMSTYIVLIMIFLAYGFMLFHFSFSIDTEEMIVKQMDFYSGWLGINRYGLVFTKWIFGVLSLVPGFATLLMMLATVGYSFTWMYFFYWIKGGDSSSLKLSWVFPVLFFSSVPVIELSNFQCQSFEVSFAMMICSAALLLEWQWILEGGRMKLLISTALAVWCFASYQAYVPVYISASLVSFALGYQYRKEEIEEQVFLISIKLIAFFACSYVIYNVLCKIVLRMAGIAPGMYIDNMVLWGKKPFKENIFSLKEYFLDIVLARNIFWNHGYLFVIVGLLLIAFWNIRKKVSERKFYLYYLLVILLLLASPFFLPVLMGAVPVTRGQLALPFVVAAGVEMIADKFSEKTANNRVIQFCVVLLLLVLIFRSNIVTDNRLFYSDYVVRQEEKALTERIIGKINEAGGTEESTIVILGIWTPAFNPSMALGETMGRTFYQWDEAVPGGTNKRVLNYWSTWGYRYLYPTKEQLGAAERIGAKMPSWPQEGSVLRQGDLVVVKMSE